MVVPGSIPKMIFSTLKFYVLCFVLNSISYKSKQFLWLVFKLLIVILCTYFIYDVLAKNKELKIDTFYSFLKDFNIFSTKNMFFLLIFSSFNWFFEIMKWKSLVSRIESISWSNAAKQSLASLSFSLITPNRIGEYGAKAMYFEKSQRKNVLLLNFIGNFHQLLITLIIGYAGMLYLKTFLKNIISEINYDIISGILIFSVFIFTLLTITNWYKKLRHKFLTRFDFITKKLNLKISLLSLLRYFIFSHQFYFLLMIFDIDISYLDAMAGISSMYFLSSIVPMLALFDFALKGSIAILVFGVFEINPMVILTITALMWVLNFAFPAIIGSYFVLRFKPIQS